LLEPTLFHLNLFRTCTLGHLFEAILSSTAWWATVGTRELGPRFWSFREDVATILAYIVAGGPIIFRTAEKVQPRGGVNGGASGASGDNNKSVARHHHCCKKYYRMKHCKAMKIWRAEGRGDTNVCRRSIWRAEGRKRKYRRLWTFEDFAMFIIFLHMFCSSPASARALWSLVHITTYLI